MQSGTCRGGSFKEAGAPAPCGSVGGSGPPLALPRAKGDADPQPVLPFLRNVGWQQPSPELGRGEQTKHSFSFLHLLLHRIFL